MTPEDSGAAPRQAPSALQVQLVPSPRWACGPCPHTVGVITGSPRALDLVVTELRLWGPSPASAPVRGPRSRGSWVPASVAFRNIPDQPCALRQCPVQSLQDVVKGLFVCCVFLDYVSLSQRFIPELINFLAGILHMATPNKQSQGQLLPGSLFKYIVLQKFKDFGSNS